MIIIINLIVENLKSILVKHVIDLFLELVEQSIMKFNYVLELKASINYELMYHYYYLLLIWGSSVNHFISYLSLSYLYLLYLISYLLSFLFPSIISLSLISLHDYLPNMLPMEYLIEEELRMSQIIHQ